MQNFRLAVRVYYEDTDSGGVVYYANYLRFLERGRTELLRTLGFSQARLAQESGIAFAVCALSAEYLKPARLDDELEVVTSIESLGRAQARMTQRIDRGGDLLLTATVRLACLDLQRGRAAAIPTDIYDALKNLT